MKMSASELISGLSEKSKKTVMEKSQNDPSVRKIKQLTEENESLYSEINKLKKEIADLKLMLKNRSESIEHIKVEKIEDFLLRTLSLSNNANKFLRAIIDKCKDSDNWYSMSGVEIKTKYLVHPQNYIESRDELVQAGLILAKEIPKGKSKVWEYKKLF